MRHTVRTKFGLAIALVLTTGNASWAQHKQVSLQRTPQHGIQPQAVVDGKGIVHLLYFKGNPQAGDLFYSRREPGQTEISRPLKVNSQSGSAIAIGTIRGGHLAVGKDGRAHVAWNGSALDARKRSQMFYTRLNDAGTAYEAQRNLMTHTDILDGGGTVAADDAGNVYVAWHALDTETPRGEDNRQVWVAQSSDDGKTFRKEAAAYAEPTGACGCCGMKGFADSQGKVYFLYRGALEKIHRDMFLLASTDHGKSFQGKRLDKWETGMCPMSSEAFAQGPGGVYTAWDTKGQAYFAHIKAGLAAIDQPIAAPGNGHGRKHPALAVNKKGEVILVWTEGTGWERGGSLAWQVYDKNGRPTADHGRLDGAIPVWSLPAVISEPDGRFTIFH
jgi:hypothetical protein